LRKVRTCS